MGDPGMSQAMRSNAATGGPSYIPTDAGRYGGGTYTAQDLEPTIEAYENIFGPSARDIKQDLQRFKRHGRWHLPDILKGPNTYLTDRIDGLITDATNSPFTSRILPYKYITNVDGKIKWNVWSFDEGLATRVPYESAARTLTQTKRSYAGYTVRQGMAIVLEHNFMMSDAGRVNFKNQLNQLIGSIQQTNDLDVHTALVLAPSAAKEMREKYLSEDKTPTQVCRMFVDLFGYMQKNPNGLDIMIVEAQELLKTWGGPMPDFLLCNQKLTFQMTMTPDVTNYVTQGPEGPKRLKAGPNLQSYRGINIIHTRAFSMETGAPPRDILRRRVRVAEYYRIAPNPDNYKRSFQLYNEERDTYFTLSFKDLLKYSLCDATHPAEQQTNLPGMHNNDRILAAIEGIDRMRKDREMQLAHARNTMHLGGQANILGAGDSFLGAMVNSAGGQHLAQTLAQFFVSVFNRQLTTEFAWSPVPIWNGFVYVPGAFDFADAHCETMHAHLDLLPPILQQAFRARTAARLDMTVPANRRYFDYMVQSVAKYPRNARDFGRKVRALAPVYPHSPYYAAAGALVAGVALGAHTEPISGFDTTAGHANQAVSNTLCYAVQLRNYNRYGIPTAALRAQFGTAGVRTYEQALDPAVAPSGSVFSQTLRNLGAIMCPNHYKVDDAGDFATVGDHLGFNLLMTRELVNLLTRKHVGPPVPIAMNVNLTDYSPYENTFLFDIVSNPDRYTALLDAVAIHLTAAVAHMRGLAAAIPRRRLELVAFLEGLLRATIAGHTGASFANDNGDNLGFSQYWMWPKADRLEDDVFHLNNTSMLGRAVRDVPNLVRNWQLPVAMIAALRGNAAVGGALRLPHSDLDPFTRTVPMQAYPVATGNDALNFFHMLAWRLWGDQERGLPAGVGPAGSDWGSPQRYLTFDPFSSPYFGGGLVPIPDGSRDYQSAESLADIEVVILRPNIEHYMLGIILGQAGEGLGSTFWGQTELSVYDDSMYGLWGMSYKYNERAIVINERNLVRLWDVAYDSYVGGKSDTAVDWNNDDETNPNSAESLRQSTMHVTRHYRGPSMMVMAFHHGEQHAQATQHYYANDYKANWPSPIVFYDDKRVGARKELAADFDNIHVIDTEEFRVFNKRIYQNAYYQYRAKMPDFEHLHRIRKNAGLAAVENEVSSDALAFQGSMRTINAEGRMVEDIMGSGHHGNDFIGVASIRNGKGYKLASQPSQVRLT